MNLKVIIPCILFISFLGVHQANSIIVPIIIPMHESSEPTSLICTKINATTSICNPPPPGPEPNDSEIHLLFIICIILVVGVTGFFRWWSR